MEKIKKSIMPVLLVVVLFFTLFNVISCEDNSKQAQCRTCTTDADCMDGLTCENFTGGYRLCATSATITCKDPFVIK
jgi:hypothetical protein